MAIATLLSKRSSRGRFAARAFATCMIVPVQRQADLVAVRVPGLARDIRVKFASTADEWKEAFQLITDKYQARGYNTAEADYRFTSYHALPDTVVLVAKEGERVVATFSLVPDNHLCGLPMEALYRQEIQQLRLQGRKLFETGSLADRDLAPREFMQVFLALMRLGWQHMTGQGADTTVITVNPRHSSFYTRQHGFAPLGTRRAYANVRGHPAEAYFLDPKLMKASVPAMHERMFGEQLPAATLRAPRLPAELVRYFAARSSQTDPRVVEEILQYIEENGSPRRW
jgi:hypothetical protein